MSAIEVVTDNVPQMMCKEFSRLQSNCTGYEEIYRRALLYYPFAMHIFNEMYMQP